MGVSAQMHAQNTQGVGKMRHIIFGLYGMTCTGKSTLGTALADLNSGQYISFGGLIRNQVAEKSMIGRSVEKALTHGRPIPLNLGWGMLQSRLVPGLNFVSGYPFRESEGELMSRRGVPLKGWVLLTADDIIIQRRSRVRSECPICHRPGNAGSRCEVHGVLLRIRSDPEVVDMVSRRKTMDELVMPFLLSSSMQALPNVVIDTSELNHDEVASEVQEWLQRIL